MVQESDGNDSRQFQLKPLYYQSKVCITAIDVVVVVQKFLVEEDEDGVELTEGVVEGVCGGKVVTVEEVVELFDQLVLAEVEEEARGDALHVHVCDQRALRLPRRCPLIVADTRRVLRHDRQHTLSVALS
jgi:hypothetical protein